MGSNQENKYVYLNGQLVENPHESHHHVSPKHVYVGVFAALRHLKNKGIQRPFILFDKRPDRFGIAGEISLDIVCIRFFHLPPAFAVRPVL